MGLILITPPAVEPVSLAELKEYLRVDVGDTSQDAVISGLEMTARDWVEVETKRRLVQQTWRRLMDFFPGYYARVTGQPGTSVVLSGPALLAGIRFAVVLDYPPVQSISNFQYQNANGTVMALNPATDYLQDLQSNPARLTPPFGAMWPVARVVLNAVQIDFTVGYAIPISVSTNAGSPPNPYAISSSGAYAFQPSDVGRPISIPGAGPNGGTLNTTIFAIGSPPSNATLRDPAVATVLNATALLVNAANGNPSHWEKLKSAIKVHAEGVWRRISPDVYLKQARSICYSASDKRY